jgi:phosphopantetheinyl transferase (holo-ACP synthase)
MLGDDVVDLAEAEARPAGIHPRFDARVFAPPERDAIARSGAPSVVRWTLWAAKEAAYKAAKRESPEIPFSPRRFVVSLSSRARDRAPGATAARVAHGDRRFEVSFERGDGWVHAIARPAGGERPRVIATGAAPLPERLLEGPDGPSRGVRELAVAAIARALAVEPRSLAIVRDGRVPRLVHGARRLPAVLSLSHHGRFGAFACAWAGPLGPAEGVS